MNQLKNFMFCFVYSAYQLCDFVTSHDMLTLEKKTTFFILYFPEKHDFSTLSVPDTELWCITRAKPHCRSGH